MAIYNQIRNIAKGECGKICTCYKGTQDEAEEANMLCAQEIQFYKLYDQKINQIGSNSVTIKNKLIGLGYFFYTISSFSCKILFKIQFYVCNRVASVTELHNCWPWWWVEKTKLKMVKNRPAQILKALIKLTDV